MILLVIFLVIVIFLAVVSSSLGSLKKDEMVQMSEKKEQRYYWKRYYKDASISYKIEPPNFRYLPKTNEDVEGTLETLSRPHCGDCIYYKEGSQGGCPRYGVKFFGIGCIMITVCDDYQKDKEKGL